ncbi:MAG: hypothetical protein J5938_06210 [Clostridia bacterium]|nr:hypothetical protein [Clostridia bacterium]
MSTIAENQDAILKLLKESFAGRVGFPWKEPEDKYLHGIRVAKLGLHLRDIIYPNQKDILCEDTFVVASYFHDICNGQDNHETAGADYAVKLLAPYCSKQELSEVHRLIARHDSRVEKNKSILPEDLKLLQDADILDHIGSYSIWATFSEFAYHHKTPYDYAIQFTDGTFDRFAERFRKKINYPESLAIYEEKISFEIEFAERMLRELNGQPR